MSNLTGYDLVKRTDAKKKRVGQIIDLPNPCEIAKCVTAQRCQLQSDYLVS